MFRRIRKAISRIQELRRLELNNQRTSAFLSQHGERLQNVEDFPSDGAWVAIVDGVSGGFYAFQGQGAYTTRYGFTHLNYPGQVYVGGVKGDKPGSLVLDNEKGTWIDGGWPWTLRAYFGPGSIEDGVYRVEDEDLKGAIQGFLAAPNGRIKRGILVEERGKF